MKSIVRKKVLTQLKQAPEIKRQRLETELYSQLFQSTDWQNAKTIAVTLSQSFELNTKPIIEQGWKEQKKIVIPRTEHGRKMFFVPIENFEKLVMTPFGVLEPQKTLATIPKNQIDFMLVPGIAFKKTGERIGFGGGYYDRFLADFQGATASLIFQEQLVEEWLAESTDIPVQKLFIAKEKLYADS